jgi:hypothetical protein
MPNIKTDRHEEPRRSAQDVIGAILRIEHRVGEISPSFARVRPTRHCIMSDALAQRVLFFSVFGGNLEMGMVIIFGDFQLDIAGNSPVF